MPGVPENEGCPLDTLSTLSDKDGDGIIDSKDDCPDKAGPIENKGCPVIAKDTDNDGVLDSLDNCPRTIGPPENAGCPIIEKEQQEVIDSALMNLEFEYNKDKIKEYSYPYLDRLAKLLVSKKDWKIRLSGHTDNIGTPEYNLKLSKDRANAVTFYLLSKGVRKDQVITEYYGDTKPIAPNDTEEGRQKNRRVEMKFVFD